MLKMNKKPDNLERELGIKTHNSFLLSKAQTPLLIAITK